jgi:hypothetical protein
LQRKSPDGAFAGVVSGTLPLNHFLFERMDLGENGTVGLFYADGTLVVRAVRRERGGQRSPPRQSVSVLSATALSFLRGYAIAARVRRSNSRSSVISRPAAMASLAAANAAWALLATSDPLTGLANRRGLDDMLRREWRRAERQAEPTSLLLLGCGLYQGVQRSLWSWSRR